MLSIVIFSSTLIAPLNVLVVVLFLYCILSDTSTHVCFQDGGEVGVTAERIR